MDKEGWIAQLGRLYKEVSSSGSAQGANAHVEQFNRVLTNLKDEFPDNEFVQGTDEVDSARRTNPFEGQDTNQEVKMKCGQLADALGYDLPKAELEKSGDVTVISLQSEQSQTAEQKVSQEVSVENVMEMVNYTTLGPSEKEELRDVVQDFEDEVAKDDPDPSILREYIEQAKGYSVDVAAKLSVLALRHGIVGVLGL